MSQLVAAVAKGRVFGLDMGDWSVLVGGFVLTGLILFLTYPVAARAAWRVAGRRMQSLSSFAAGNPKLHTIGPRASATTGR
jgi:hypothetical protein